jgi:hypothetical protein
MPRELIIPPTRFRDVIYPQQQGQLLPVVVWQSPLHTLKYSVPGLPPGSDRSSDFTVNGFLRMQANPDMVFPSIGGIRVVAGLVNTYAGGGGAAAQFGATPATQIVLSTGQFVNPLILPFYNLSPASPRLTNFPQFQSFGSLGDAAYLLVSFGSDGAGGLLIDVTFEGAIVSSDPILEGNLADTLQGATGGSNH